MWSLLLVFVGVGCLFLSKRFQRMAKNVPIAIVTSAIYNKQRYSSIIRKRRMIKGSIYSSLKAAFLLKLRYWASQNLDLGKLEVKPTHYEIVYYVGSQRYKIFFSKKRGPKEIVSATTLSNSDEPGKDVTNELFEAMGPSKNFYGIETTPKLLGYNEGLKITYRRGIGIIYLPNDNIKCSLKTNQN